MKTLELNEMESFNGGDAIDVVNGVCLAIRAAGWLGWLALNNPVGYVVTGACIVHGIAQAGGVY